MAGWRPGQAQTPVPVGGQDVDATDDAGAGATTVGPRSGVARLVRLRTIDGNAGRPDTPTPA